MKIKDRFWLWGHPAGRFDNEFGNTLPSRMTPMEGCLYLGVNNAFMVPCMVEVNERQYMKSFKTLGHVGWETYSAGKNPEAIEPIITLAKEFPNLDCVVFDDFIDQADYTQIPVNNLYKVHDRLHNNDAHPMDMWMVLYTREFGLDAEKDAAFGQYIDPFDGIIMWTWKESDVPQIPAKYEVFKRMTEGKRRMFGCYLYNFGENKQATGEAVKWQLDWYRERIIAGEAEGVVLHTNTMADLDFEAYDVACKWMEEHGEEDI